MQEAGLPDLLDVLRWRWKLASLVALSLFLGAFFYIQDLPPEYEGQAVVALAPRVDSPAQADTVRLVAPKYVAFLTSPATIGEVAAREGVEEGDLAGGLDASIAPDSGNLLITVTLGDAGSAARAANTFASSALLFSEDDELLQAESVAQAVVDEEPSGPPRRLLQAAALVLGVLVGLVVALLIERSRPRVRTWREMHRLTALPIVGRIPHARSLKGRISEGLADPAVGAAFRTLRTNLENEWKDRTVDVIVVTSPTKSDGKTTVAALFAESLARLGAHTLLLDADARRPGLTTRAVTDRSKPGLVSVLREEAALAEALQPGWVPELHIVGTESDAKAGDLLATRFPDLIQEARERFDIIVVDSPPLLGTDEAHALATFANGVLLVVAAGSMAGPLNEALLALQTLKAPVLGIVANRLRDNAQTYYA